MRIKISMLAVGMALTVLLAAGCGDDSEAAITKQAFVKQADAICAKQRQELEATKSEDVEKTIKQNAAALRAELDGIEKLGMPSDETEKIEEILDNAHKALQYAEAEPVNANRANQSLLKAEELADDYGFKRCFLF